MKGTRRKEKQKGTPKIGTWPTPEKDAKREKKYLLVKGEFGLYYRSTRHVGSSPDGDSAWFRPYNPVLLSDVMGRSAKVNPGGFAQLRYEAIDALELHFERAEQNHELAVEARDFNVDKIGFAAEYSPKLYLSVRSATPTLIEGYILTRGIDRYGRPVSFVFSGTTNRRDGGEYFLDLDWFDQSINAALVKSGSAYPGLYTTLPKYLRSRTLELISHAQRDMLGIWRQDQSTKGFMVDTLEDLEELAIWPKLFRRLVTYFNISETGLENFEPWLRSNVKKDDEVWIVSEGELGNMHDVIDIRGNELRMLYPPGDLAIIPQ